MKSTCATHINLRFDVEDGNIHPAFFEDYCEPDPTDPDLSVLLAESEDLTHEIFLWLHKKEHTWCIGSNYDHWHSFIEVQVDPHCDVEKVEQSIIQFCTMLPNFCAARNQYNRRMGIERKKNEYNPAYAVILDGINKMMGCK